MLIRPFSGPSSLAIRMLDRKRPRRLSLLPKPAPRPLRLTARARERFHTPSSDPLANPLLTPLLQTVQEAGPLPRLHRRGPIEASIVHAHRRPPVGLFHGFIAVAPLKPLHAQRQPQRARALPRLHRRGPIEAA